MKLKNKKEKVGIPIGFKKVKKYIIPTDWNLIKLGDATIKVGSGKTPRGGSKVYQNRGIPFIRSQNVMNNKLDMHNVTYINEKIHSEMDSTKVLPNDVLLNITGASIGRCCTVPKNFVEGNLNQHVCIIRAKNILNQSFLMYTLLSHIGQNQIMINQAGGNREGINFQQIRSMQIPFPPMKEQQKIVSILSTWDKAIELKEKLIEQKKEQKKGLIQNLLTGEVRLPGFDGDWMKKKIGDCILESREIATDPILEKRLTVRLNLKGIEQREVNPIEKVGATTQYVRKAGQFIYGKQNLHKGAFGLIPEKFDGYQTSSDIPSFNFKKGINAKWFFYYMSREGCYRNLEKISTGTGSKRINPKDLYILNIKVPGLKEQREIANVISTIDKELELLNKELYNITHQKKGLMQLLLTGKARVKA